ncbi:MAG: chromosome segregation protein SMC, partial [Oscillospiraceae bacterium]|nr:chromosome segregation protein SMC [Oscillospiraceae bacterium]
MYLKSLELQGFKSFPDKIKLGFDKGLTAVVGPNGSGKSNIGDSIRWVLGEQSTKTLRGNKMEDVIFSGTVARKPVGFASVTLTLDNADRALNSEDDEVSITRKLYRSGDSEYKINGKNVRLKDINELFMDTGLGRDGYSIIGQGRIAEIVSAKSNERRDIFEEAAGISKFRYKKVEAERKLSAAQDNLIRLNDIVGELENRVGPLKNQAEKAEKFVVLAQQRKTLEISVWVSRLSELKAKLDELENNLLLNKNEYENIQNDIDREEEKIREGYRKIQESSVSIENLREKILETEQSSSQFKSDIAVCENDISHSEESLKTIALQKEKLLDSGEKTKNEIQQKLEFIKKIKSECSTLENELSQIKESFEKAQQEADALGKNSDSAGTELNNLYIRLSEIRSEISNSEMSAQDTQQQLDELQKQRQQLSELAGQYESEKEEISDGLKDFEEKSVEFSNMLSGVNRLLADKQNKLSVNRKECEEIRYEIRGKEQRKKLLSDLENNMEGFARSVKEIIKASRAGRIGGIRGTVAQLINVKQEYATAVETALGGAMQNVIVEDDTAAKRCIRLLKEQKSGRATFLPMTSVRGNILNEPRLAGENGFVSMANELVEFDSQYQGIVNSLLGRTAVAEDIDSAAVIAKKFGYRFKIVTLDGQVVNAGGSFTGGSAAHSAGVFSRKNELEAIDSEITSLNARLSEATANMEKIEAENKKLERKAQEINEDIAEISEDKIKFSAELSRIEALQKQAAVQAEDFENRYNQLVERKANSAENAKAAQSEFEKIRVRIR